MACFYLTNTCALMLFLQFTAYSLFRVKYINCVDDLMELESSYYGIYLASVENPNTFAYYYKSFINGYKKILHPSRKLAEMVAQLELRFDGGQ